MDPDARDRRISRRSWLLAGLVFRLSRALGANVISVSYDGETLRAVAPGLHFLTGKSLDRLKNADTVVYVATLSLLTIDQSYPMRANTARFVVSYDIWEEKFKVTIPGSAPRSRAGMTASQAEAWCLDSLGVSSSGLAADRPFFLRLELRAADPKEFASVMGDPGLSLRAFMELLSRKAGPDDPHWGPYDSGTVRLSELRAAGRGARTG